MYIKFLFSLIFNVLLISLNSIVFGQEYEWQRINPLPFESTVNAACQIPGISTVVTAGNYSTLMFTDDSGENWDLHRRPAGIGKSVNLISICFPTNQIGYLLGSESLILKTTECGLSWYDVSLNGDTDFDEIYFIDDKVGFLTGAEGYILRTEHGGMPWDTVYTADELTPGHIHFVDSAAGYLGATFNNYFLKTIDKGISWYTIQLDSSYIDFELDGIYFLNQDTGFITSSSYYQPYYILKTNDGGQSWHEVYQSYLEWPNKFYFIDKDTGFAYGPTIMYQDILLRTTNGGETWDEVYYFPWHIHSLIFSIDTVGILFGSNSLIYRSFDFGLHWEKEYSSITNTIFAAEFLNDSIIIAGSALAGGGVPSGRIIKSSNRGITWQTLNFTGSNSLWGEVYDICFASETIGYMTGWISRPGATWPGTVLKTMDGGNSWQPLDLDYECAGFRDIECVNEDIVYVTGYNVIFKSQNGGHAWSELNLPLTGKISFHSIHFVDELIGFAAGSGPEETIIGTTDGGVTWEVLESPTPVSIECIRFYNEKEGIIFGSRGTIFKRDSGIYVNVESEHFVEKETKENLFLYPNPARDIAWLKITNYDSLLQGKIRFFDLQGKIVLEKKINSYNNNQVKLDLLNLTPGVYVVQVNVKNHTIYSSKLIIID